MTYIDVVTEVISESVDNTFAGTLIAGLLLGYFGIRLYRRQKETDIEFEFLRKRRELAAELFSKIDLAMKHYDAQVNIYNGKNPQIKLISEQINQKHDNHLKKESDKSFNEFVAEITKAADSLVSNLKLGRSYSPENIAIINTNVAMFNVMLMLGSFFEKMKPEDIENHSSEIGKVAKLLTDKLQGIISAK